MGRNKKREYIPRHGVIRSKRHVPRHLPLGEKRERAGWWLFFAALVSVVLSAAVFFVDLPFSFLWGSLGMLGVSTALMIVSLLKATKKAAFPAVFSLVVFVLLTLFQMFLLWFFFYSYAVLFF